MPITNSIKSDIARLIEINGAMGVNQLAKELNIPLSTLQKYLDKDQNYFKKNYTRKWELPDMSANTDMAAVADKYSNVIESQLMTMNALIETLMAQFRATVSLIDANKGSSPPVAGKVPDIDARVLKTDKTIKDMYALFKKYIPVCPKEYQDLLKNLDLTRLTLELGNNYMFNEFNTAITPLFTEQETELSDDMLDLLSEYQL